MKYVILTTIFFCLAISLTAQPCSGGTEYGGPFFSQGAGSTQSLPLLAAGEYTRFYVCAGTDYTFHTCPENDFDTYITLIEESTLAFIIDNNDFCGAPIADQASVNWTATFTGWIHILLTENLVANGCVVNPLSLTTLTMDQNTAGSCLPPGYDCLSPDLIATLPYTATGLTTCGSGNSFGNASACGSFYLDGPEYIFEYTASATSCHNISLSNSAGAVGLFVFDACGPAANCVGSVEEVAGDPTINIELTSGVTYYFLVSTDPDPLFGNTPCTAFDIAVDICPTGTVCSDPVVISSVPYSEIGGTTCGFGNDYATSSCGDVNYIGGEDYVLEFTPSASGCFNLDFTNTDTYLGVFVWDACPDAGTNCIASAENGSATDVSLDVNLVGGTTYYFIVSTWPAPACSNFDFVFSECPPGSTCSDPVVVSSLPYSEIGGTTCGFGNDYATSSCGDVNYIGGEDYVIEYTPSTSGCFNLDFTNTDTYLGVFVWDACPDGGSNCIASAENGSATDVTLDVYLEAATTYYFIVSTWPAPACSDFDFVFSECAQDGETCANAINLPGGNATGLSNCAMGDNYDDTDACGSTFMNGQDVVMTYTAPGDGCYDVTLSNGTNANADVGLFILDGCPDAGATCIGQASMVNGLPSTVVNLVNGNTYTIVVASNDPECTGFDIDITSTTCPAGDVCANPIVINPASLPTTLTNQTSCNTGNDYTIAELCGETYGNADDVVYEFTPSATDCYTFEMLSNGSSNAAADVGMFILDGCPDAGSNCIISETVDDGMPVADAYLSAGVTYYVVISAIEFTTPVLYNSSCQDFDLSVSPGGTMCPAGVDCNNPLVVNTGTTSGVNLCGMGNDYDDADACGGFYSNGEDVIMTFTPGVTDCYNIGTAMTANSNADADVGLYVLSDCPDAPGASCLVSDEVENGFPNVDINLTAGVTYYIMVSAVELISPVLAAASCTEIDLTISGGSTNCPPGINCSNPINIPGMGTYTGMTSCGFGDDYSDTDVAGCGNPLDFYLNAEETVMTFTPGTTDCYIFETSNGSNPAADPAIFIFDNCPDQGPNCIATGIDEDDMPATTAQLTAGVQYYIVFSAIEIISNSGGVITYGPSCTDFDLEISTCPPQVAPQDCDGAIPVCQNTYTYNDGFLGAGANTNEIPAGNCLATGELNSVWFIINVQTAGDLGFLITPMDPTDDYDFAVFDISTNGCAGIPSGASPELSCNYSISAGVTGATLPVASGLNSQGASGTLLNSMIPVTAGQTIVLVVSNFSTSLDGFDLDFSPSTATIFDATAPDLDMVAGPINCFDTSIDITFTEPITCASIATCDFTVTFPDATVHNVTDVITGGDCEGGANFGAAFTFVVDAPMDQDGTYTLNLGNACGGVEDNCTNIQDNTSITFDISNCASCIISSALVSDVLCDNNGTPSDPSDDTYTFNVTVSGIDVGASWTANDPGSTTGAYDTPVSFGPFPISGGDVTFTVTDIDDNTCTLDFTATAPATCSDQGLDCTNPIDVFVGPNTGMTSCGAGDDYEDTDVAGCNNPLDFYLNAEETVMTFTPPSTDCYIFETSNGSNPAADPAIFIFDDCPDQGPNCITTGIEEDDMPATTAYLTAGVTYYIVFSAIEILSNTGGVITYSSSCTDFDLEISSCPPELPPQDCDGAIPICQNTYTYTDGFIGAGLNPNEIPGSSCLATGELNSVWFVINVQTSGNLSFLVTPVDILDDYDFAVYDISTNGCSGIPTGASPEISCNYSISAGVTGAQGPAGPLNSQGASGTLINNSVPVTAGQTLALIVSNFNTSLTGFDIDFSTSTASIFDATPPDFDAVAGPVNCLDTSIDISFTEPITCASIATCDFTVTFPDASVHNITDVLTGGDCDGGANFGANFTFVVDAPMDQNGTYTLNLGNACGGVEDNCTNIQNNTSITFDITNCAVCNITAAVSNVVCDNNGTTTDGSDDTYTFDVTVTGVVTGATWTANDPGATTGAYNTPISFGPFPVSGGDVTFTVTDIDDNTCTADFTATAPMPLTGMETYNGCEGDGYSVVVNGTTYDENNPTGTEVFVNAPGCDSIVTITLTYNATTTGNELYDGCQGDGYSVNVNGTTYNEANPSGTETIPNAMGCDSVVTIALNYNATSAGDELYSGCQGDGYSVNVNGTTYNEANPSGTETIPNAMGCDSVVTIALNYNATSAGDELYSGCQGDGYSVVVNGTTYNEGNPSGTETLTNYNNCDSVVTVSLTFASSPPGDNPFNAVDLTSLLDQLAGSSCGWVCDNTIYNFWDGANPPGVSNIVGDVASIPCDISSPVATRNDIWFKFTHNDYNAWIDLYQNISNIYDLVTVLYEADAAGIGGDCNGITGLTYVACADDATGLGGPRDVGACTTPLHNRLDVTGLINGRDYYLRIIRDNGGPGTGPLAFEFCVEVNTPIPEGYDLCTELPSEGNDTIPSIGCISGQPNVNVDTILLNQSNAGCTGNQPLGCNNGNGVLATAAGLSDYDCDGGITISNYINNVVNNNVHYSFRVNATVGCAAEALVKITFDNMITSNGAAQVQVVQGICPSGGSSVMASSYTPDLIDNCFSLEATLPNGLYYIVLDGQDATLLCYDLRLEVTYDDFLPNCNLSCCYPPAATASSMAECDDGSGTATFDLTTQDATISGGTGTVNWYTNGTPIGTPSSFSINMDSTVYATVDNGTCESLPVPVPLTINLSSTGNEDYTGCQGDVYSVVVNGTTYDEFNPTGTETLVNYSNCDSIVTINLVYNINSTGTEIYTGCQGDGYSVVVNGTTYNEANPNGVEILTNYLNCDSLVTVDLVFNAPSTTTIDNAFCQGDGGSVIVNGTTYNEANPSGTETMTNYLNCDSVITVNLTFNITSTGMEVNSGCQGDGYSVIVNGTTYNEANPSGAETLTNYLGCDSLVTIDLTFGAPTTGNENYNGCIGDGYSVVVNGTTYNEANTNGTEILTNFEGCDSTVTVALVFSSSVTGNEDYNGCIGDGYSVVVNGTTYNEANSTGTETLTSGGGCDSIVTINLVYNASLTGTELYDGCQGDGYSVTVNSVTYNEANSSGSETLMSSLGCDSIVTITLTYNAPTTGNELYDGCQGDGYAILVNGTVYNESNSSGTETIPNAAGCDSVITIALTYNAPSTGNELYDGCQGDGYSVVVNGTTYNEGNSSGTETIPNAMGCDSVVTIALNYNAPSAGDELYSGCQGDGYSVVVNGTTYNEANSSGSETIPNAMGCDSVVTIALTYSAPSTGTETYMGCQGDGYTVDVNGTTYNEANATGAETLVNYLGCDSLVTINLVYNAPSTGTEDYDGCNGDGYSVVVNGTTYNEANPNGTEILSSSVGCDSTVTIDLVFSSSVTGNEDYNGCIGDGYSVVVNGTTYNESNSTGTETLTSGGGCDSIVTINLVYNANLTGTELYDGCQGDGYSVTVNSVTYNEANSSGSETLMSSLGCDSIVTITLTYNAPTTSNELYDGCQGDGYAILVNGTVYNESNSSGTETIPNAAGCDSVITIALTYNAPSTGNELYDGCQGDGYSVNVNGTTYNESNSSGTETIPNAMGCDSVVTIALTYSAPSTGTETYMGCQGDGYSVVVNGTTYNEANATGAETLVNYLGCDSLVTINLVYNAPSTGTEDYDGCNGDGYSVVVNGTTYNEANPNGTEILSSSVGCDSTVTIALVFSNSVTGNEDYNGCIGDGYSVVVNGTTYNEANSTGTETLTSGGGCDSIVTINLVYNANLTGTELYDGCQGDGYSVTVNSVTYNEANSSGSETLMSSLGCDSIVTITLTYNAPTTSNELYDGCQGDGYAILVNGTVYNESNSSGTETIPNAAGCDSIITIALTYDAPSTGNELYDGCQGDGYSVVVNGTTYNEANSSGTETIPNAMGCDSVVTIALNYNAPSAGDELYSGCQGDGYSVVVNGTTYNEANPSGTETIPNAMGCDSVVTIALTYSAPSTGTETYMGCQGDGYTVDVNGTTYNEANATGAETLVNYLGCDSLVTINLVYNAPSTGTEDYDGCNGDGYSVVVNGTTYNEANPNGTEILSSSVGCDSTVTIALVFSNSVSGNEDYNGCIGDGYSVVVNGTTYNEANSTGTETLTSGGGCDSIVTINLVYNSNLTGTELYDGCQGDGYSVTVNSVTYNEANSSGSETLMSSLGCDSIVTITLTYNAPTTSNELYDGCQGDGYAILVNGTVYNQSNSSGTETIPNAAGCDSIIAIALTYDAPSTGNELYDGCQGDGYSVVVNGTTYNEANSSGTETIPNAMGCDSVVTIALNYNAPSAGDELYSGCQGDGYSVVVNGTTYNEANPSGTETIPNAMGCDSVVTIALTYSAPSTGTETYMGCQGDGYTVDVNGTTYNEANATGAETLVNYLGCDSLVTINLVYNAPSTGTEDYDGCNGDGYSVVVNGTTYNEANPNGTEILSSSVGCDSTVTIALVFSNSVSGNEDYNGCIGDGYSVVVNGTTYNEANSTGTETLTSGGGCDSIVTINLVYNSNLTGTELYDGCQGDGYSVTVNSVTYNEANSSGSETLMSSLGCDSIVTITLTYNAPTTSNELYDGCQGDGYAILVNGTVYNQSNSSGTETIPNAAGCDSIITINLIYNAPTTGEELYDGCQGDGYSVNVNGTTYNEANSSGTETIPNAMGCDSVVTITLNYNAPSTGDELYSGCQGDGYSVVVNGTLYDEFNPSGTEIMSNAIGCDSTVTINLTYNAPSSGTETYAGCVGDGYSVDVNGTTYNEGNPNGVETLNNYLGCDSLVTVILVYNAPSSGNENYDGCIGDGYSVNVNGTIYNESNPDGTEILPNSLGCDSTVTIALTFSNSVSGEENYNGCIGDGYFVVVNGTNYDEFNPTGTETIPSSGGCDSIITIDLVYNTNLTGEELYNGCAGDGYSVVVDGTLYDEFNPNGSETLMSSLGCDSIVTVNLTYNAPSTGTELYNGCTGDGYAILVNGTIYNEGNANGIEIIPNAAGCDSTITIDLMYDDILSGEELYNGCAGDGYSVVVNGSLYDEFNPNGSETMTSSGGCDSTVTVNLTYNAPSTGAEVYNGCEGDGYSVIVNGTTYNEGNPSGVENMTNAIGCDSTVTIVLNYYAPSSGMETYTGCEDDGYSVVVNGTLYDEANATGVETLTNYLGCDSLVTIVLTYNAPSTGDVSYNGCNGDGYSVNVNGTIYNESNPDGTEILPNSLGCDSTVTIALTFSNSVSGEETYNGCIGDGYFVVVNGTNYDELNPTGTETIPSSGGCDSIITIDLVYNTNLTGEELYNGCAGDGYSVVVDGTLYDEFNPSGSETMMSSLGCDSIVTVNLTYNAPSTGTVLYNGCTGDGYAVLVNGTIYNEGNANGIEIIPNAAGCDSTITIDLMYNDVLTGEELYDGCEGDGYSVVVNGSLYDEFNPNGTETMTSSGGCDSTVSINLTYNSVLSSEELYTGCENDGYSIIVNGVTYNETNPNGMELLTSTGGCDSILMINLIYNAPTNGVEEYTGCENDGYEVTVNGTLYNEVNPSGVETLTNYQGCDSVVVISLSYELGTTGAVTHDGCVDDGFTVTVNGTVYDQANPTGTEILTNAMGCDSTVTVDLMFNTTVSGSETYTGCFGDGYSVVVNGTTYDESNQTGTETLTSTGGCDSIVTITLEYGDFVTGEELYEGCQDDGYEVTVNGTVYNQANPSGSQTLVSNSGCDSIVMISLVYEMASVGSETYTGCNGDGYAVLVNGTVYNESNPIGDEILTNAVGCDSLVTITLAYNDELAGSEDYSGCEGDGYSVTVGGTVYNETNPSGTETLISTANCDSVVTINLVFTNELFGEELYSGCEGDNYSVVVGGTTYDQANPTGTETLNSSAGCDSTVTINLSFSDVLNGEELYSGCQDDGYSVMVNGTLYDENNDSGVETLMSSNGCDSVVVINLTYEMSSNGAVTHDGCIDDGFTVTVNGTVYDESNPTGTEILTNAIGCDSIVSIDLMFNTSVSGSETYTGCFDDGYSVVVNGITYDESNPTGTETLTSTGGCDSIVTITLEYGDFVTGEEMYEGCQDDGYEVTVNGTVYNQANPSGSQTLLSSAGCDSIVMISLVYEMASAGTETYTGCNGDGYAVLVNGIVYNESNPIGEETLTNAVGCDSVVTITLTYNDELTGVENYNGCEGDGYSVTVGGTVYDETNPSGTENLISASNCDSIVTINLVFTDQFFGEEVYSGCEGDNYSVVVGGTIYNEANPTGTEMLTSTAGCDSTVTINLSFSDVLNGEELYEGCQDDGYSVMVNGTLYDESNDSGVETLLSTNGCDSVVVINLTYEMTSSGSVTHDGCIDDGFTVTVNGTVYDESNPTGTEILTNAMGCDSTVIIDLMFNISVSGSETYTGCFGDGYSVVVNGTTYDEFNPTGTETLTSTGGCDSIVTINLEYGDFVTGEELYQGCQDDGYEVTVNGTVYNQANPNGSQNLLSSAGCDSIVMINLIYEMTSVGTETYTGCNGDGYAVLVNGTVYNESNPTGEETLTNAVGCDSVVTITLAYNDELTGSENYEGCEGDGYSVTVGGTVYDETNPTGTENLISASNCDSIVTINLVFTDQLFGDEVYEGCAEDSYSVTVGGTVYDESNPSGTEMLISNAGCDSIVTINLVYTSSQIAVIDTECDDNGTGDPLDDTFTANINVTTNNAGVSNTYMVSDGTSNWGPFTYGTVNGVNGLTADGNPIALFIVDADNPACEFTVMVSSAPCSDCAIVANAGTAPEIDCDNPVVTLDGTGSVGAGLSYEWTTFSGNFVGGTNTAMVDVNASGLYILTILEPTSGCIDVDSVVVTQNADVPVADAGEEMTLNCLVMAVILDGSGSDQGPDISYVWTGPGITTSNMNQLSPQVTLPGLYTLTVTNFVNNCSAVSSVTVIDDTDEPVASAIVLIPLDCSNTTLDIDGTGSASGPNITYQWLDGNMNPIPGETSPILTVSTEGFYTIQVTDTSNGCVSQHTVDVDDITAYPFAVGAVSDELTCNVTEVDLDASNSTVGIDIIYEWFDDNNINVGNGLVIQVSLPGEYTLVVTDTVNNCTNDVLVTVVQNITPPVASAGADQELDCNNTETFLDGSGSSSGNIYTYQWISLEGNPISNSETLLPQIEAPGFYEVIVTNTQNGCTSVDQVEVLQNQEVPVAVAIDFSVPTCAGDNDGVIVIDSVIGGQGPFLYTINTGMFTASPIFTNLSAGTYELIVEGPNGCTYVETIVLADGNDLTVNLGEDIYINLGEDASFSAEPSVNPFELVDLDWLAIDSLCQTCLDQTVAPMSTSNYLITIEDENGCVATDDLTVFVNEQLEVYIPSAFSPNGDGNNDKFMVFGGDIVAQINRFEIFSRWGAKVFMDEEFQPNDSDHGWDGTFKGKPMDAAVFVYIVEIEFINGEVKLFSGDVTLIK